MDHCRDSLLFHQGPVRFCEYIDLYFDFELWGSERQHFPIDLLLGCPANLILIWKNRKSLDPKVYLPLAAYVNQVTEDGSAFKANISAVFIADNIFRIILYSALGLLTMDTVRFALLLILFALPGLVVGIKCSDHMDEKLVKKMTSALLILSGISLILKNL